MGLDMYLSKKTYVKNWSHQTPEEKHSVEIKKGGVLRTDIKPERVSYVTEEVMYWRKANQIHGWFCNNTEELVDNVKYDVTRENLEQLLSDCKKVLEILNASIKSVTQVEGGWKDGKPYMVDVEVYDNVDEVLEILPPTQGFFFGSETIDDWYKQDIENTINVLTEELEGEGGYYSDYEYYASW
jgi:hypothetical protein